MYTGTWKAVNCLWTVRVDFSRRGLCSVSLSALFGSETRQFPKIKLLSVTFPFQRVVQIPVPSANKDSLLPVLKGAFWSRRPHYSWKRHPWDMQEGKQWRPPLRNEPANFNGENLQSVKRAAPLLFHRCLWGVQIVCLKRQEKFPNARKNWLVARCSSRQQSGCLDTTDDLTVKQSAVERTLKRSF